MLVLKRNVTVDKSAEEVISVLRACAYPIPRAVLEESDFSFYYPKRKNRGLTLVPVKGMLERGTGGTTVFLEIHACPLFYVGSAFAAFGACCLPYTLLMQTGGWFASLLFMLIGTVFSGASLCTGIDVLDLISYKLKH